MTVDVSVTVPGRIDPERIASAVRDIGGRDVEVEHRGKLHEVEYFSITFGNPHRARQDREMRCHVSTGSEPGTPGYEHLGDGEYTYMTLGLFDGAEDVMEQIALRFGGWLEADEGPFSGGRWMGGPDAEPQQPSVLAA